VLSYDLSNPILYGCMRAANDGFVDFRTHIETSTKFALLDTDIAIS